MSSPVINVSALGFFTVLLVWTLNGDSGRDMNDVVVDYIAAQTQQIKETSVVVAK